jgi:hypothetical protein
VHVHAWAGRCAHVRGDRSGGASFEVGDREADAGHTSMRWYGNIVRSPLGRSDRCQRLPRSGFAACGRIARPPGGAAADRLGLSPGSSSLRARPFTPQGMESTSWHHLEPLIRSHRACECVDPDSDARPQASLSDRVDHKHVSTLDPRPDSRRAGATDETRSPRSRLCRGQSAELVMYLDRHMASCGRNGQVRFAALDDRPHERLRGRRHRHG